MKKVLLVSIVASLLGEAALAQEIMNPFSLQAMITEPRGVPVIAVFYDDRADATTKPLSDGIREELERSDYFDLVPSPVVAARITAPTSLTIPVNNRDVLKVGFEITFPRGGDMDLTVTCPVDRPRDCGKAIRTRAESLYRQSLQIPIH